jgi:RNA polymerase sigma-70 factor (ECF subfamily)
MTRFDGKSGKVSGSMKNSFLLLPPRPVYPVTESGTDDRSADAGKQADMPSSSKENPPYPNAPRLTLVTSTAPDNQRTSNGQSDWSALMAKAQDGDRDAYRSLLKQIEPYVRSIAVRCFNRPADAEDVVQDVLLTVHAIRNTYDPKRPFGPWLVAVANRRIIDRLRRHTRQKAREIELSAEHETFADAPANLDSTTSVELALVGAIDKLPPDQREAIRMLKLNEMSLKEASQASGRSIAALKVATHRAIRNLRQLLRGEPS